MPVSGASGSSTNFEDAIALFEKAVAGARRALPEGHWITGAFLGGFGKTLIELQRYGDAERALLEAHEIILKGLGPNHERTIEQIELLTTLYEAWGNAEKTAEWRAKLPAEQEAVASDKPG